MGLISRTVDFLRASYRRMGVLAGQGLLVFIIFRIGDLGSLVCRIFLGRWLKAVEFGAIDPFFAALSILALPTALVCQIVVKSLSRLTTLGETGRASRLLRDASLVMLVGSIVSAAVVIALGSFILDRLHLDSRSYIFLMAVLVALTWWTPFLISVLQGCQRYLTMATLGAGLPIILTLLTVVLVGWGDGGLEGALAARVGAGLLITGLCFLSLRRLFMTPAQGYGDEWKVIKQGVLPMLAFVCGCALLMNFDRLFVRNFMLADSGGYAAIITVGQIPLWFVGPVVVVLFPFVAAETAGGRSVSKYLWQALLAGFVVTVVCTVLCVFFSDTLFSRWNKDFLPYSKLVWPFALAMGLQAEIQIVASVDLARHQYRGLWWLGGGSALMCILLYVIRASVNIEGVILVQILGRVIILAGMLAASLVASRNGSPEPSSVDGAQ